MKRMKFKTRRKRTPPNFSREPPFPNNFELGEVKKEALFEPLLWALRDSNPRPSGCKPDALNQLS